MNIPDMSPVKPPRPKSDLETELNTMEVCVNALDKLDKKQQERVLNYLYNLFEIV